MEPDLTFTIPSVHDGTVLDCRVYYPKAMRGADRDHGYRARGAIIAHPYAPLGGCYDDPVVSTIVSEIMKVYGFVCTFNFRGAYGSAGRTSWTGKAERADFVSVIGFMVEFLHLCHMDHPAQAIDSQRVKITQLVLGGYSYGSWICDHLAPIEEVQKQFQMPAEGSAAAEIKARAQHLATQWNTELDLLESQGASRHHGLVVGGEEVSSQVRRSGEHRFNSDIRASLDIARRLSSLHRRSHDVPRAATKPPPESFQSQTTCTTSPPVNVAYLLVSPLLPPISSLTTLPLGAGALRHHKDSGAVKLSANSSLAVFGDDDTFTSGKKLRQWAQDISDRPDSRFQYVEVAGAGHFWRSHEAQKALKTGITEWLRSLDRGLIAAD